jgi:hypothetical protein
LDLGVVGALLWLNYDRSLLENVRTLGRGWLRVRDGAEHPALLGKRLLNSLIPLNTLISLNSLIPLEGVRLAEPVEVIRVDMSSWPLSDWRVLKLNLDI